MRALTLLCALLVAGCVSTAPQPVSGDRAAGVVRVAINQPVAFTAAFQDPDWTEADAIASERCVAWGYSSADAFGVLCDNPAVTGKCMDQVLVREYQCVP